MYFSNPYFLIVISKNSVPGLPDFDYSISPIYSIEKHKR
eukprot:UN03530